MAKDMTKGSLFRALITFSVPLILSGILQQLYSWADAFIVGNIEGEMALAAIGATGMIVNFFISVINGFTSGISILAAQRYGSGNIEIQKKILYSFILILGSVFAGLSLAGVLFADPMLVLVNTPEEVKALSREYLQWIMVGIPFLTVYNIYSAVLRGIGDSKAPFYSVLVSSVTNVLLDMVFVGMFGWGVAGAAIATSVSQIMMTVFIILYSVKKYEVLRIRPGRRLFDRKVVHDGCSLAIPVTFQWTLNSMGNLILQNFMNSFGTTTVAAITTAYRVDSIIMLPVINLGTGISTITSQNTGAGEKKRAKRCLYVGSLVMAVVAVILTFFVLRFGGMLIGLFGVTAECVTIGDNFFHSIAWFYIIFGSATALRGYLQGTGEVMITGMIGIGAMALRIVLSYVLKPVFGNMVIAYAEAFSWCFMLIMYLGLFVYKSSFDRKRNRR